MKFLLTAVNAKYIHSNPAIYSLRAYSIRKEPALEEHMELAEYTINQPFQEILADIYGRKPDCIAFSCYIWNWEMIQDITRELAKILPDVPIWLGGPEVSYNPEEILEKMPFLTGVMVVFLSIFGVASHSPNGKKEVPKNGISTSDIPTGILQSPYPTTGGAVSTSLMAITKTAIISRALWLTALAILFRYPFHGVPCLPGQTRMRRVICRHPLIFRPPMYSGCLLT